MVDEIRIVIADDHPIFRRGLRQGLEESQGLTIIGEAGDGKAALEMIKKLNPDVAVLDISMPVLDGFAVARELAKTGGRTRLIFLTGHQSESLFEEAIALGVRGYALKEGRHIDLVNAVRAVFDGMDYMSPELTTYLIGRLRESSEPRDKPGLKGLTPTERRILKLIAGYKTSREIADELFISYHTVETHRRNICEKLDLHGTHALMKFALTHTAEL